MSRMRFIALNRDLRVATAKRETAAASACWQRQLSLVGPSAPQALLQTHMDERDAYRAAEGLTVRSPTPEQDGRTENTGRDE